MKTLTVMGFDVKLDDDSTYTPEQLGVSTWRHCKYAYIKKTGQLLHRLACNAPHGLFVDHINCDGLDNRRCNLRIVDASGNQKHSRKQKRVKFKGIYKSKSKWCARIKHSGKRIHLGNYDSEKSAALAYDAAAKLYFGELATTNF
jgi:hypothetical protein